MKKLGIVFATIVILMLFVVSASALEPTGQCGDNVFWEFDESSGELVISGEGDIYNYDGSETPFYYSDIQSIVIEDGITAIGDYTFCYCENLSIVTIPDGVTSIGTEAFFHCKKLTNIILPNNITSVGFAAFAYCQSLVSINIPNSISLIDDSTFVGCTGLINISIPDSVKSIDNNAFEGCTSLTSITIPNSVTSIGRYAFSGCKNLISITVDINNQYYSSDEYGVLFNKDKSILFQYPTGNTRTSYIIPDSVISIGDGAFQNAKEIANITIPDSVASIGGFVFSGTAYYNDLSNWEKGALYIDKHLVEVNSTSSETFNVKKGTLTIAMFAFRDTCNPTSIIIPDSIVSIGYGVSRYFTKLTDVYYSGSRAQWLKISIASSNNNLKNATMHYHFEKPHTYNIIIANPTCTAQGYTTYTCECGDTYIDDYVDALGHDMGDYLETTAPTCTENGEATSYCSRCNYTKKRDIDIIDHSYKTAITPPTCTEQGYTTYTCECGDTYIDDYIEANGHTFTTYISDGKATCITDGLKIAKCDYCDATDSISEKGGHSYSDKWTIDIEPTCTEVGSKSHHCIYCEGKTDITPMGKLAHTYNKTIIEPTCTDKGYNVYTCPCGDTYTETIEALGHSFDGSACTECDYDKADECSCNCHKSGIAGLIWKILNFFYKLFKLNPVCSCGALHY